MLGNTQRWVAVLKTLYQSRKLNRVSESAEVLYRRLLEVVDDNGNYYSDPNLILGYVFAHRMSTGLTAKQIKDRLDELKREKLVAIDDEQGILHIVNHFTRFRSDRKTADIRFPEPNIDSAARGRNEGGPNRLDETRQDKTRQDPDAPADAGDKDSLEREGKLIDLFANAFLEATGGQYMRSFGPDRLWARRMITFLKDSAEAEVAARLARAVERNRTDPKFSPFPTAAHLFSGKVWNRYAGNGKPSKPVSRAMTPAEVEASLRD